jgi:2-polyprenylphenol 6-hydroxylase
VTQEQSVGIIGAGPVGLAAALALSTAAGSTRLTPQIWGQFPDDAAPQDGFDARVLALSPSSRVLLEQLGVWAVLPPDRITPVRTMQIWSDAPERAPLTFSALAQRHVALAWIVEHRVLMRALLHVVRGRDITLHAATRAAQHTMTQDAQGVHHRNGNQECVHVGLLIAEGGHSVLRAQMGFNAHVTPYQHSAVVTTLKAERGHNHAARQWFSPKGYASSVLALLPMPDDHVTVVWSTSNADAARLQALTPDALAHAVQAACRGVLGTLSACGSCVIAPLQLTQASRWTNGRVALIGDAAHTVHPLAGQGLNLGFGDVEALRTAVASAPVGGEPLHPLTLQRYARARQQATRGMQCATDGLWRLFAADSALSRNIRQLGMSALERVSPIKSALARRALG